MGELAKYLDKKHPGDYLVFNLSNKNRNVLDYGRLGNQVLEFQPQAPLGYVDDAPGINQTFRIVYTLAFWLAWDAGTVAVLHCNKGIHRSGFVVAAYLLFSGAATSFEDGLAQFSAKRFPPRPQALPLSEAGAGGEEQEEGGGEDDAAVDVNAGLGAMAASLIAAPGGDGGLMPSLRRGGSATGTGTGSVGSGTSVSSLLFTSWRHLMRHMERMIASPPAIPKVHRLVHIILALPGLPGCGGGSGSGGGDGATAFPIVQLYAGERVVFDSQADCVPETDVYFDGGKLIVNVPERSGVVCGDYQLWVRMPPPSRYAYRRTEHPSFGAESSSSTPGGGGRPPAPQALAALPALTDDEDAAGASALETDGEGAGRLQPRGSTGVGPGVTNRGHYRSRAAQLVARVLFHTSTLGAGVESFSCDDADIFHGKLDRKGACATRERPGRRPHRAPYALFVTLCAASIPAGS